MKHPILSRFGSAAFLLLGSLMCAAAPTNPFFAMDTAMSDGKLRSSADAQAELLKELGYAGIRASGYIPKSGEEMAKRLF
jgi:hypothetical protein